MPEGDTIHRSARGMSRTLHGHRILAVDGSRRDELAALVDRTIERVEARGKHLLLHASGDWLLHTHMAMTGSWHLYRAGERWKKPRERATAVLHTVGEVHGSWDAVGFSIPTLVVGPTARLLTAPPLSELGPDLLDPEFDLAEALRRLRHDDGRPIGVALMDQRCVAGIGNVYKSELLFRARLDPFQRLEAVDDTRLVALLQEAQALMRQNLRGFPRKTTPKTMRARAWVYDRSGRPCFVCGGRIRMQRQGATGRSTYYCPRCQEAGISSRTGSVAR